MTETTRRAVLMGLSVAPVAGVSVIAAETRGLDPALAAIAEWRELKTLADADAAHLERIEDAYIAETALDPIEGHISSLEDFDWKLRAFHDAPEVKAMRTRVERAFATRQAIERRLGMEAAREKSGESDQEEFWAKYRVLTITPTTPEGALALLEFTARWVDAKEGLYFEDERATAPARAIRAALAVLRSGSPFSSCDFPSEAA